MCEPLCQKYKKIQFQLPRPKKRLKLKLKCLLSTKVQKILPLCILNETVESGECN